MDNTQLHQQFQKHTVESLGILASGLGHELGNPLGVVRGRTELLLLSADADQRKNLLAILSASERMANLIQSILNWNQSMRSGGVTPLRVMPVLEDTALNFHEMARMHDIEIGMSGDPSLVALLEPNNLRQVLHILILNAFEAIEKAKVMGRIGAHQVSVVCYKANDQLIIEVVDSGAGIQDEHIPLIFQPFFSTKTVNQNVGIGLTHAHFLLSQMNGQISVAKTSSHGTTMRFSLAI